MHDEQREDIWSPRLGRQYFCAEFMKIFTDDGRKQSSK